MERIKDIHQSYEFQNFSYGELKKIKIILEIKLLEHEIERKDIM